MVVLFITGIAVFIYMVFILLKPEKNNISPKHKKKEFSGSRVARR
jgi:hypothetical protein